MKHPFLVLHFGAQCPWQPWVVEEARAAAGQLGATVRVASVMREPELALHYRLFFPLMIVVGVGERIFRLPSPMAVEELMRVVTNGAPVNPASSPDWGQEGQAEELLLLTVDNISETCRLCIGSEDIRGCQAKTAWAVDVNTQLSDGILGLAAYHDGLMVGAIEFLPASVVPYPLPEKSEDIAFITCVYSTRDGPDYRGQVLKHLIRHLQLSNYRELQVVAGRRTPYPNGPEALFRRYGFEPLCEVDRATLEVGEEVLVLLRRKL